MSFNQLWNLLYYELGIIEYDCLETKHRKSEEKIYKTSYDSVIKKLKEFKKIEFIAENRDYIWFKITTKQTIINKIQNLMAYESMTIAKRFVDCISQIWINCGIEDFKIIVEEFNKYPYIIYSMGTDDLVCLRTWGNFCEDIIEEVREYYCDEYDKILDIDESIY